MIGVHFSAIFCLSSLCLWNFPETA